MRAVRKSEVVESKAKVARELPAFAPLDDANMSGTAPTGAVALQRRLAEELNRTPARSGGRLPRGVGLGISLVLALCLWGALVEGGILLVDAISQR
jgi:hypothetical protein